MQKINNTKFSIGYNYEYKNFCNLLEKYQEYIESIYFPLPKKYLGSGRNKKEPKSYENDFYQLINLLFTFYLI